MRTLDEEVAHQWKQYEHVFIMGVDPKRVFDIAFALGCYYTVERMKPNGTTDKEPEPPHKDIP